MDKKKMTKKGTHIVKRLLAAVCTAALVLGLLPGDLGVMSVQAEDEVEGYDLKLTDISTDKNNPTELAIGTVIYGDDETYDYPVYIFKVVDDYSSYGIITFQRNSKVTILSSYKDLCNDGDIAAGKWMGYVANKGLFLYPASETKAATITTLSAESITVNYGETWTLTAQAKADGTNIDGATVAYYSDAECKTKLEAAPTAAGTYYARGEYAGSGIYEASNSDVITVTIKEKAQEPHTHTLVHYDEVAATTTTPGTKEYWQCSGCGKYFSDADGKNEISAPESIPVVKPEDPTTPTEKDNVVKVGDDENSGKLTVESDIDTSAPATTVATKASDILSILEKDGTLTVAEIADIKEGKSDVEVILGVKNNNDSITEASRDLIKEKANAEGMTIAEYMDITLTKYIIPIGKTRADVSGTKIEKLTNGSIAITVTIPDGFKNTDASKTRTYYVLRNHDNAVSVLNGTLSSDGNEFTFTTDKFSDYVLTYKDTAKPASNPSNGNAGSTTSTASATTTSTVTTNTTTIPDGDSTTAVAENNATSPKTGENNMISWMFVLLLASTASALALKAHRRKEM